VYVNSLYKNPFEHSQADLMDAIDFDLLRKVTVGMVACIRELAGIEKLGRPATGPL
jgi:hypothetical protein